MEHLSDSKPSPDKVRIPLDPPIPAEHSQQVDAEFVSDPQPCTSLPNYLCDELKDVVALGLLWILQSYGPDIKPSIATLSEKSGLSERKIQLVLKKLEDSGFLQREERRLPTGGQTANRYRLRF